MNKKGSSSSPSEWGIWLVVFFFSSVGQCREIFPVMMMTRAWLALPGMHV